MGSRMKIGARQSEDAGGVAAHSPNDMVTLFSTFFVLILSMSLDALWAEGGGILHALGL